MQQFTLTISNRSDIPAVLSESLCSMGSLAASRADWASLLRGMGIDLWFKYHEDAPVRTVSEAAKQIVVVAVPEEGDPHPQRAMIADNCDHNSVAFDTPAGVRVAICPATSEGQTDTTGIDLTVDFGRDSKHLATLVLADIFRRVPAAAPLLAEAAKQAADEYAVNA
ncbi:hypothetical protein COU75_00965 [Candidatus Peregrinibacteria bacterium CG10_big_fil_rev_8_21_14_0_10_42_8]|nr:MAG: hypothetical protein COU75_00965 [Candidatus Peregrinibacteria bacterium CG10_big_fil_rev_8_21_14_0_10_42_8]